MKNAIALLFLLLNTISGAALAQGARPQPGLPPSAFNVAVAASVFSAALAFIAPRALDAVTVQQLALWGLGAPASLDAALSTDLRDGAVLLLRDGAPVFTRKIPPDDTPESWAALVAEILAAAAEASPTFNAAGTQGAISAFFDELFNHLDPYSRYVAPVAADVDRARRSGEAGAGLQLARQGAAFIVSGVNADGPGAEAGIRLGDRIVAVDGQPTAGEDLDTVQSWILGLEGTDVSITVRTRGGPARTIEVERAVTPPETVFVTRLPDYLLLRITAFSVDTDQRLARELDRNLAGTLGRPVRGIVLDLRGNRGGLLRQAVAATNLLLDRGIVATTAGRNPQAVHIWRASTGDVAGGRPLIVLVDGRSASAAEIMAAALEDQGRAVVVGSATLGKGLVQTIATLPDGGELFVSWSRVLAPAGWPIQGLGVLPQLCTSLGQDATSAQLQSLDRGTQSMEAALARHRAARAPLPAAEILALRNACPASEARDADLTSARFLITHPAAYAAARPLPALKLDQNAAHAHVPRLRVPRGLTPGRPAPNHKVSAMAKNNTVQIKLISTADTGYFYVTKKNARTTTGKLELRKYDPVVRKHVAFKEAKIK